MEDLKLYSRKEVADMLSISVRTLDRLVKDQKLPCVFVGKNVRFDASDIKHFVLISKSNNITKFDLKRDHDKSGKHALMGNYQQTDFEKFLLGFKSRRQ